jgi:hypothetical protein
MDGAFLVIQPGPLKAQSLHATEARQQQKTNGGDSFRMLAVRLGFA